LSRGGCLAIYVKDKIVLILRDKLRNTVDNGVWLATTQEHHQSLRREFPNMRSIQVLGKPVTGWQVLPVDSPDFESAALRACELVLAGDPRIGKIPGTRTSKSGSKAMVEAAGVEPASEIVVVKEKLHAQSCSEGFALRAQNRQDVRIASPLISPLGPVPSPKDQPTVRRLSEARRRSRRRRLLN
jgi:hypothetical protein